MWAIGALLVLASACEGPRPEGAPVEAGKGDAGALTPAEVPPLPTSETPSAPRRLLATIPADGSTIYAKRMYDASGARAGHVLELVWDAAPGASSVALLLTGGDDRRTLPAVCDGPRCVAEVPEVDHGDASGDARKSAFRYGTPYTVTVLAAERDPTATFSFGTLPLDEELEHTCGHTLDPDSLSVLLAAEPSFATAVSQTHRRHRVAFPLGLQEGIVSLRVPGSGAYPYALYLSQSLEVQVRRVGDGVRMAESTAAVPPVCDRLVSASRVTLYGGEEYEVRFTTRAAPTPFELYLERRAPRGATADGGVCRTSGPCTSDAECCDYCHDRDHCH